MNDGFMKHGNYIAKITYDPDEDSFYGYVVNIPSHIDFYGRTPDQLREEFANSVKVYNDACEEQGVEPDKGYSGKFNLRLDPALHASAATNAAVEGLSLNSWVIEAIKEKADG